MLPDGVYIIMQVGEKQEVLGGVTRKEIVGGTEMAYNTLTERAGRAIGHFLVTCLEAEQGGEETKEVGKTKL